MKIRAITLENVRRFIDPVTVGPIGDGVTLLCEPNEAGKSTLFDALHALFFIRHAAKSADIKALQPHSGGKVVVECKLEHEACEWRIRKEWISGPSVKVWRDGTLAHQGDAAEDWISALVAADAGGPGGLLWVRQGRVSLKAPEKRKDADQELQERRDLLTAISGVMDQVTGGERMDRVRDRVEAQLSKLQTTTGRPKTAGRWAEAEADVERFQAQETELARTVDALRADLDTRRRLMSELSGLEDANETQERQTDLDAAKAALLAAEGLAAQVASAEMRAKLARQNFESAKADSERADAVRKEAQEAKKAHESAGAETRKLLEIKAQAEGDQRKAKDVFARTKETQTSAEATLRQIDRQEAAARSGVERARLTDLLTQAEAAETDRIAQQAIVSKGPDAATVARIEGLAQALDAQRIAHQASAPKVAAIYQPGAEKVQMDGWPLEEGERRALAEDGRVEMPGIGSLEITFSDAAAASDLTSAQEALQAALEAGDWLDLESFRKAVRSREAADRAAELAAQKRDTLAPDGLDGLRTRLAALGEANDAEEDEELPARQTADDAVQETIEAVAQAEIVLEKTRAAASAAVLAAGKSETAEAGAKVRREKAEAAEGEISDADPDSDTERLSNLEKQAQKVEAEHAALADSAPDIDQLRARYERLKGVVQNAASNAARIRGDISKLEGRIETRGEEGVEEILEGVRGRLGVARDTLDRVVFEKDVLVRLLESLNTAQKAARDTYFAPVAAELQPLMAEIWEDAELLWADDTLLPKALVRRGTEEPLDVLSGGTQEQIAFLVRLAFARLLAKSGRHAPLILDDALVYSDDDRIEKMFDALHGAAGDLQIIVLSCRQRAFRDLGAPAVRFEPVVSG